MQIFHRYLTTIEATTAGMITQVPLPLRWIDYNWPPPVEAPLEILASENPRQYGEIIARTFIH